jgi:hypothetical protein
MTYRSFFAASADVIARGRAAARSPRDPSRPWRPEAETANWEGQQPPLYYAVLAPAFAISKGWSLQRQLFLLRSISYLIAWLGLCVVAFSPGMAIRPVSRAWSANAVAIALWPALFPMWFIEMGRLGNDSLVAFFAGLAAILIPRTVLHGGWRNHLSLGVVCALGLLTKATFIPLVAAIIAFLCYRTWLTRHQQRDFRRFADGLAIFATTCIVVAGWWYISNLYHTGSLIGSNDEAHLSGKGHLLSLAIDKIHTVPLRDLIVGPIGSLVTFLWVGAWSFVLPPPVSELPLAVLVAVVGIGYMRAIMKRPLQPFEWIFPLTLVLFAAGLIRQALILFVEHATLSAPGWYLHSLSPIFASMLALGLAEVAGRRAIRPFVGAILIYPILFLPFGTGLMAIYYAGCGDRYPGHASYDLSSASSCFSKVTDLSHSLSVFSDPYLSMILFGVGWVVMLVGVIVSVRMLVVDHISPRKGALPLPAGK